MLDAHWSTWVATTLPALGGQTPMEAVHEADGRAMVMARLDDMERHEQSQVSGLKQRISRGLVPNVGSLADGRAPAIQSAPQIAVLDSVNVQDRVTVS